MLEGDEIILTPPTYPNYYNYVKRQRCKLVEVPMFEETYTPDFEGIMNAITDKTKVIFLCSPNNPSGNAFELKQLLDICDRFPGVVVVDEAYSDFSEKGSLAKEATVRENLIVLQTLSKARAMAGLRIGLAISSEEIIRLMSMVKYPYNLSRAAMEKAFQFLDKSIDDEVNTIVSERKRLASILPRFPFVQQVFPSDANFILVRVNDANAHYDYLLGKGIIVRNRTRVPGCAGCLRLTVGLPAENESLLNALDSYTV
jgi:histidinol-phosphate aminotransferase